MTTINLRKYFYWYKVDEYIEVSDEVAEELRADKDYEINHWRRMKRNKSNYSWTRMTALNIPSASSSRPRRSSWPAP